MNIAITAHDAKKELMVQFCIAYCGILSRYTLCGTGTTSKMVSEATGLEIQRFLSGAQGGGHHHRPRRGAHPRPGAGRFGLAQPPAGLSGLGPGELWGGSGGAAL